MIKQTLYPKTKRVSTSNKEIIITEKLDGSNLTIFKYLDKLVIAQRNSIFSIDEVVHDSNLSLYKGLKGWLLENREHLEADLHDNAALVGEWIGMGLIGYGGAFGRFAQFAKANIENDGVGFSFKNIYYDHDLFHWSFVSQETPSYINRVPIVQKVKEMPTLDYLNQLYDTYSDLVSRKVEGFVIIANNSPTKYVRYKNGEQKEHQS